jgi:hypothetical protein
MKQIWTGPALRAAGKYGEHAPMAAVCCNACRTSDTTNLVGLAAAAVAGVGVGLTRFASRLTRGF